MSPGPATLLLCLALSLPAGVNPLGSEPARAAASSASSEPRAQDQAGQPAVDDPRPADGRTSRVDYDIRARLDGPTKRLAGELTLTWHNRTGEDVSDLWFHLYHNAFANNRSSHLTQPGGPRRVDEFTKREDDEHGWQRVTRVVFEGEDVTDTLRYRWPNTGAPTELMDDRTVASVDLPRVVRAGETVRVDVTWEAQLPRVRRRTGYKDDFLLVAHWFPKLGVYEAGRGWNAHQFHRDTEFFSSFGAYRVALDLPAAYAGRVGGTGKKVLDEVRGDRVEVVFEAPSRSDRERPDIFGKLPLVHGFAWTADTTWTPDKSHPFRWSEWAERYPEQVAAARRAFGEDEPLEGRDVDTTLLIQPERSASQAARHAHATHAALFFYGLWYGPYPYEGITVVDPRWGGRDAGGMEYPTLFTAGTQLGTTPGMHRPESVTLHEAGHQFWYGLVGNNEFEAAWLDEGLNSYTDSEVLKIVYGDQRDVTWYSRVAVDGVRLAPLPRGGRLDRVLTGADWSFDVPVPFRSPLRLDLQPLGSSGFVHWWRDQPLLTLVPQSTDPRWADRRGYLSDPATDAIDTLAFEYAHRTSYRTNSYPRPAVMLRTLKGLVGEEAFLRGMRHFAGEWRYRHPYPEDFYEAFLEGSGTDVGWFLEDAFRSRKTVDWSVTVEQDQIEEPAGYFQEEPSGPWLRRVPGAPPLALPPTVPTNGESSRAPLVAPGEARPRYEVSIQLARRGELCLPLRWMVRFEDDHEELHTWTREEQLESAWHRHHLVSERRVESVVLDPEALYYIDLDMSNNRWYRETSRLPALRWGASTLNQIQHLLHWYGGIGG